MTSGLRLEDWGRSRVALVAAVAAALALTVAACGGSGNKSASTTTAGQDRVDAARTHRLRNDLNFAFGGAGDPSYGAPWYSLIKTVAVAGRDLDVRTEIYPDDDGRQTAKQICNILNANYVLAHGANYGLQTVTVYGQRNDPLSFTSAYNGHC